ncbi:hypothetical protein [Nocardioides stalactiti]|uniref:hypothetical protein n=1 Tax=Nocardioides stalactiti TaxID=2755356 RepID=UPI0016035B6A|nr:hypothetical protein [Nocardioides stalactiti]
MLADLTLAVLAAPEDEDVVAGPIGFIIFIALILAVAILGWSLTKHLKKTGANAEAGVFGDPEPADTTAESAADGGAGGASSD